jgi:type I restriction enzyme S subunit
MSDWAATLPLTDALEFREGPGVLAKDFHDEGVPLIRLAGLKYGAALLAGCNYLDPNLAATKWGHFKLQLGDVLLSTSASLGEVAVVDESGVGAIPYTGIIGFRPKDFRVSPEFVRFLLTAPSFKAQIEAMGVGSVMKHFGPSHLKQMSVSVPPLSDQEAIADVLGAVDEKIATNVKLARTSSSLTQAIFAEAVRVTAEEAILSEITALLGRGITPKYTDDPDGVVILNQKCIRGQRVDLDPARRTLKSKVREDKLLMMNDVLVNSTGQGTLGRVARWTHRDSVTVDSHITIVRFDHAKVDGVCAGMALLSLQETIVEMGEGSTGQTELSRTELGKLRVRLPDRARQAELGQRFTAMAEMEREHLRENQILAAIRDALLPQLMSGKLRVRDAEKVLENAGV